MNKGNYHLPPVMTKADGSQRRVGFELEFSGISLEKTVNVLKSSLDAGLSSGTVAEQKLSVSGLGDFQVELDWSFLKRLAADNNEKVSDEWVEPLSQAAALLVPVEVVCPPIPIEQLAKLDPMVDGLRKAGAIGTEESLIAAYGVHINTEIPDLDAPTLLAYVKAYCILQWWLVDEHEVNFSRKMSPYVDLYPEAYLKLVLTRSESSLEEIIDDYLEYNPTRNRALDLLPLLSVIDEQRVKKRVNDKKIQSRPAFHYRLPNCHIEHPGWSLCGAWNTWIFVEKLANDLDALDALSNEFALAHRPVLGVSRTEWVRFIDQWLKDRGWL